MKEIPQLPQAPLESGGTGWKTQSPVFTLCLEALQSYLHVTCFSTEALPVDETLNQLTAALQVCLWEENMPSLLLIRPTG